VIDQVSRDREDAALRHRFAGILDQVTKDANKTGKVDPYLAIVANVFGKLHILPREETERLVEVLEPYGLIEFVRSARIAIIKESKGFHEKIKDFERTEPSEEVVENEYLDKQDEVFSM